MKLLRTLALVALLPMSALAGAPMSTVQPVDGSGVALGTPANPLYVSGGGGGGGGGATGSVTSAGTNGSAAQAVQGIAGGVPQNSFPAQYNSTLPALASGATGYLAIDSGGRLILSPVGVAQDATLTARLGTLGQKTMAGSTPVTIASDQGPLGVTVGPYGLGAMAAVPGASSTGTPLSASPPAGKRGARLYVPPGASITFTVASAQPSSAPSATITVANPSSNTIPTNWDEDLNGQMIYVTAVTGSPLFRWY